MSSSKLLPTWFTVWLVLSCIIFFVGGLVDEPLRKPGDFNPWGASITIMLLFIILLLFWRSRVLFQKRFSRSSPLLLVSVCIGVFFAEFDELLVFMFNPIIENISLGGHLLFFAPMYLFTHIAWFFVLRKYRFTSFQAFVTGGISLGIFEVLDGGFGVLTILFLPWVLMIHGFHMVMPQILLKPGFSSRIQKDSWWKYAFGIVLPALGNGAGMVLVLSFMAP